MKKINLYSNVFFVIGWLVFLLFVICDFISDYSNYDIIPADVRIKYHMYSSLLICSLVSVLPIKRGKALLFLLVCFYYPINLMTSNVSEYYNISECYKSGKFCDDLVSAGILEEQTLKYIKK